MEGGRGAEENLAEEEARSRACIIYRGQTREFSGKNAFYREEDFFRDSEKFGSNRSARCGTPA